MGQMGNQMNPVNRAPGEENPSLLGVGGRGGRYAHPISTKTISTIRANVQETRRWTGLRSHDMRIAGRKHCLLGLPASCSYDQDSQQTSSRPKHRLSKSKCRFDILLHGEGAGVKNWYYRRLQLLQLHDGTDECDECGSWREPAGASRGNG